MDYHYCNGIPCLRCDLRSNSGLMGLGGELLRNHSDAGQKVFLWSKQVKKAVSHVHTDDRVNSSTQGH